ncbi:MAG: RNA 2',3'-cyclic phosphodiesterase [Candidatus Competibacter sp.]|nr:RNA 2',3'-cyclic phosphodiesterase [Candidatus Competibacter sp.]MDG4583270.1 RNA 2',3'-cyclic phosphodiesterase [Candidatus Competibacter sp.]
MRVPTGDERRLFLALWPGDAERRQLAERAAAVAGRRRVRDANLHLTLVFLGATDAARLAAYEAALTDLAVPSLELSLDRYGYWPRPRILWLGSSHTPPELYELVAELHRRLRGSGFAPERRAFQAHITLARKFPGPAPIHPLIMPIRWRVEDVALVESQESPEGSRYRVLRRWPGG